MYYYARGGSVIVKYWDTIKGQLISKCLLFSILRKNRMKKFDFTKAIFPLEATFYKVCPRYFYLPVSACSAWACAAPM